MNMQKYVTIGLCAIVLASTPLSASADFIFNPHLIITDEELVAYRSMTLGEIEAFLEDRQSGLVELVTEDYDGVRRSAAEIIYQAAHEHRISPRVLLATLQKEQSLVTERQPSQNQLDKAMGYRCPDNQPCNPKALGFGKQVDGAAWQFREYLNNHDRWTYRVGKEAEISGYIIKPQNKATAGLYNYTPHYSGNNSFWRIWVDFFGKNYPDGSLVQVRGEKTVWLIRYGIRRAFTSYAALTSRYDPKKILTISKADLEKYQVGPTISFANYSLLRAENGDTFLLVDDTLRKIASEEVFRRIGFNWEEVEQVVDRDLLNYQLGDEITLATIYPTGALLQDATTGGVFFVKDGIKQPIHSREIMQSVFVGRKPVQVAPAELDSYATGRPVLFKDGELIKADTDSQVYVIANGKRHWIPSEKIFAKFGYRWDNIITTTPKAVMIHDLGEDIK